MNGTVWVLSYVLLWASVLVLGFTVVALLRQVGVLHTRIAPMGVHFAGEGPELDEPAPTFTDPVDAGNHTTTPVDYSASPYTLVAFTSPTCEVCARLKPSLERIGRIYDEIDLRFVDHATSPDTFSRFRVRSTPYLVAIDADGVVRSRGVANTLDQVEEMLAEVLAGPPITLADSDSSTPNPSAGPTPVDEPVVQL